MLEQGEDVLLAPALAAFLVVGAGRGGGAATGFGRRSGVVADVGLGRATGGAVAEVTGPRQHGAFGDRERLVRDDPARVDLGQRAQAVAARAGAERAVERKHARGELDDLRAVNRTGHALAEGDLLAGLIAGSGEALDEREAVGLLQRGLDRVGQPLADLRRDDKAVDDDRDVVLEALVERDRLVNQVDFGVDLDALEALARGLLEELLVFALAAAHDGGHNENFRPLGPIQDLVDDLLDGLLLERPAADRTVRAADVGIEDAQVIVDFGDGADGRAGIAADGLLLDRNRRAEPLDMLDVGFVHLVEELAGVGGERLDVAALAFGVNRVEGERALARAGQAGHDGQRLARDGDVDVFEVMLRGAGDDDVAKAFGFGHGDGLIRWRNSGRDDAPARMGRRTNILAGRKEKRKRERRNSENEGEGLTDGRDIKDAKDTRNKDWVPESAGDVLSVLQQNGVQTFYLPIRALRMYISSSS
ncbi:MAG: hypothetical protein BWZ08_00672 [candidate division BRC1 bacterium ADurb.BinA292]|nr:MAG: hypothetical protein BWZ08_00672 [candidate division BRC1 bacterium ADurb.BinA292]